MANNYRKEANNHSTVINVLAPECQNCKAALINIFILTDKLWDLGSIDRFDRLLFIMTIEHNSTDKHNDK